MKMPDQSTAIVKTEFLEGQGIGNQLWIYASGKAIARRLGRPHVCDGMARFKGRGFIEITSDADPAPCEPIHAFHEEVFYDEELKYFSSTYDERVFSAPSRVLLNGLFQSESYLSEHIGHLREWLRPSKRLLEKAQRHQDTCVINIRGGEYKRHKRLILPEEYWRSALEKMRNLETFKDILVVSDDFAYAKLMFPDFPVLKGSIDDCYAALMGAKCAIVSNSSFAYFPLKTRCDDPCVIAPEHWARFGDKAARWAMPSNCYSGWQYLTRKGDIRKYAACKAEADRDARNYELNFNIRLPNDYSIGGFYTRFIPKKLKGPIRRVLSKFLPGRF